MGVGELRRSLVIRGKHFALFIDNTDFMSKPQCRMTFAQGNSAGLIAPFMIQDIFSILIHSIKYIEEMLPYSVQIK